MNCGHIRTILGILKAIGLVLCIIAASSESAAYYLSPYHDLCQRGDPLPPLKSGVTEETVFPMPGPPGNPSTQDGTEKPELKDMAPVLWMERFQISTTWMGAIVSLILLVLSLTIKNLDYSKIFKAVNFGFYFVFSVLLITSAVFVAYSAVEIDRKICQNHYDNATDCQKYKMKMAAAGLTLLTGVLYASTSVKILGTKLYEQV